MKLLKSESQLIGHWFYKDGKVVEDDTCKRIDYLVKNILTRVTSDESGWDILYLDRDDKRLWELTYPNSEMHGGGPPSLTHIDEKSAVSKYGNLTIVHKK